MKQKNKMTKTASKYLDLTIWTYFGQRFSHNCYLIRDTAIYLAPSSLRSQITVVTMRFAHSGLGMSYCCWAVQIYQGLVEEWGRESGSNRTDGLAQHLHGCAPLDPKEPTEVDQTSDWNASWVSPGVLFSIYSARYIEILGKTKDMLERLCLSVREPQTVWASPLNCCPHELDTNK